MAFCHVLSVLPDEYRRDGGQYLAGLAHASTLAGLPEQACQHATESLAIATRTGSSRTVGDVRSLMGTLMKRWPRMREVRQLRDTIDTLSAQ